MTNDTTRNRLIQASALLFRQKGYNGVGVSEILAAANAPKGSLYHHFPNGKADLATAAAQWTLSGMIYIIDDAFKDKTKWQEGVRHFVGKLAKLFDVLEHQETCPVKAMLFDGPDDKAFQDVSSSIFERWQNQLQMHATKLGLSDKDAQDEAEMLLIAIEGAWTLARVRKDSGILRKIPDRFFG